jgi:hypothetical protein
VDGVQVTSLNDVAVGPEATGVPGVGGAAGVAVVTVAEAEGMPSPEVFAGTTLYQYVVIGETLGSS